MEFESSIASHRATPVFVEIWIIRDLQNFSNYTQKILTHFYINAEIHLIHLQMHNEAQKQAYYPFSKIFKIQTIMDKSPWDSLNVTSILCVSQVLSQKAVLSFYKSMSPPPSPPNTMLKDQRNCALTVSTLSVGWGEGVGTYSVSSARIQFRVG